MFVTPEATDPPSFRTFSSASLRCMVAILPVNRNEAPPRSTTADGATAAAGTTGASGFGAKSAGVNPLIMVSTANPW